MAPYKSLLDMGSKFVLALLAAAASMQFVHAMDVGTVRGATKQQTAPQSGDASPEPPAQQILRQLLAGGVVDGAVALPLDAPEDGLIVPPAHAVATVTLAGSIDSSYQADPEVGAQAAAAEASRWLARSSLGKLGPKADVEYARGREHSTASGDAADVAPVVLPNHTRTDQSAVLRQPLVDVPALVAWKRDERLADAERSKLAQTRASAAFDVAGAYDDLIQYQLLVVLAQAQFARTGGLLDYMTRRAAGGAATEADRERVRGASLNADRDLLDARSQLVRAEMAFARLTGLVPAQLVVRQEDFRALPPDTRAAMDRVIASSPALAALREQLAAATLDRQSTRAGALPKLDLTLGSYGATNASGTPGSTRDTRLMLNLRMNLLNGGSDYAISQAQAQQQVQLQDQYEDALRKTRERLQTNYLTLASIRRQAAIARQEVQANLTVTAAFDAQFAAANRPLLDVLTAYEKLYASQVSLVRLFVAERRAIFQIFKDTGDIADLNSAHAAS